MKRARGRLTETVTVVLTKLDVVTQTGPSRSATVLAANLKAGGGRWVEGGPAGAVARRLPSL